MQRQFAGQWEDIDHWWRWRASPWRHNRVCDDVTSAAAYGWRHPVQSQFEGRRRGWGRCTGWQRWRRTVWLKYGGWYDKYGWWYDVSSEASTAHDGRLVSNVSVVGCGKNERWRQNLRWTGAAWLRLRRDYVIVMNVIIRR